MENQKEIEKMAIAIGKAKERIWESGSEDHPELGEWRNPTNYEIAQKLIAQNYGDTKQATEEIAEKIKENLEEILDLAAKKNWGSAYEYINQLVKDFCEQK